MAVSPASYSTRPPWAPIAYAIAGCSEHSGRYVAENIKVDRPLDQMSRWSGAHQNPNAKQQWLLLELETVSVLKSITFGKFHKPHPCNMKEFKLLVGMSEDHMTEVLHSTLKNDSIPETIHIPHTSKNGVPFPTRFVKISSLSTHGHNFNTSIWHVALRGITDERYVQRVRKNYESYRETVAMRQILKHLRQRRHISAYRQLLASTGVQLEHPLITQLYESLVLRGDWSEVDRTLHALSDMELFNFYIQSCQPQAVWKRLQGVDANGDIPSRRGGHAMCLDEENSIIYLFGGWDGQKSLDDFWEYNIQEDRWRVISHSVAEEKNGPGPRACHKMVFDPKTGCIYVLGRLSDGDFLPTTDSTAATDREARDTGAEEAAPTEPAGSPAYGSGGNRRVASTSGPPPSTEPNEPSAHRRGRPAGGSPSAPPSTSQGYYSEFYRYRTRGLDQGKWELLAFDTATSGGPPLVYDHQLVLDSEGQLLHVQGGRVVDGDCESIKYAGLYSYDIRASKWKSYSMHSTSNDNVIPPRFGHSMLLEPRLRRLYIFAGQQEEKYLSDMWEYDLEMNSLSELFSNFTTSGGPEACFAQRAVLDPDLRELYVFAGLTKSRLGPAYAGSSVWLYRYDKRPGQWVQVLPQSANPSQTEEPRPRCAHQVVYDAKAKTFYMHGGNAGLVFGAAQQAGDNVDSRVENENRLDDFWSMTLKRPAPEEVIRRATFEIRCQQFREMCEESLSVNALAFLQTEVSSVVNHGSQEETAIFRNLLSHLLAPQTPSPTISPRVGHWVNPAYWPPPELKSESEEPRWTNELPTDEDTVMADASSTSGSYIFSSEPSIKQSAMTEDVGDIRDTINGRGERGLPDGGSLSTAIFQQRTEVFEKLLAFVSPEVRQPSGNLLDMLYSEDAVGQLRHLFHDDDHAT